MRSLRTWVCLGAVLLGVGSRVEAQADPDVRDIPPLVMLVVDSSGSMEDQPACICNSNEDCSNCEAKCGLPNDATTLEPPKEKKNRWAVTLEALTGKFKDFQCMDVPRTLYPGAYDELAPYVYHQPWKCPTAGDKKCDYPSDSIQERNGILDNYRDTLQFGLMTYDGEATYIGASSLIPAASFNEARSQDIQGMWSYGKTQPFMYYGCADTYAINTGARSIKADEGALISLGSTACGLASCDMYQINESIQTALLKTRPYGGTPIAASLDDLYTHLEKDVPAADPYVACRKRYAFLITDGAPDDDFRKLLCNCEDKNEPGAENIICPRAVGDTDPNVGDKYNCPYPTAAMAAQKLVTKDISGKSQIEKLFVLGMSVSDPGARTTLDAIAKAGNTDKSMFADDPNTLRSTLDNVFGPLLNPVSRSVPGFATGLGGVQYQISAGFQVSSSAASSVASPWMGLIERRQFICDPKTGEIDSPELEDKDRFHKVLNGQETRRLYTALPGSGFKPEWLIERMGVGENVEIDHCGKYGCDLYALDSGSVTAELLNVADDTAQKELIQWMYGDNGSPREKRKLGDIYHSSPALVGPPKDEPGDDAYTRFRTEKAVVKERPLVMYVTSNDGILHAISVEDYPLTGFPLTVNKGDTRLPLTPGEELWGFVPPILLPELHHQLNGHKFNFDGTPVVKDVYFKRGASAAETDYHTVLITGMRGGGNAYIAMDVTDPFNPKFLWQFTDPGLMGKTYGQPEIVQATFKFKANETDTEEVQTRAVAILPGGIGEKGGKGIAGTVGCITAFSTTYPDGYTLAMRKSGYNYQSWRENDATKPSAVDHRNELPCWKAAGRALYFVDVETGKLIKKVFDTDNTLSTGIMLPAPIVGSPTAYPDAVGTIASKGFVLDADGVMWRIDMSSQDPMADVAEKGWTMRPFHDLYWDTNEQYAGQITYERPILSLDRDRRLVVIVGTGNTDKFTDSTADNRIVSLTEVTKLDNPSAPEDWEALINWEHRYVDKDGTGFLPSELVTGSMALFEGQLFAASFVSNLGADACEYGRGRLWSFSYLDRAEQKNPKQDIYPNGDEPGTYQPRRIAVEESKDEDSDFALWNISKAQMMSKPEYSNLLIQGLSTTQRLSCYAADPDPLNSYFAPNLAEISQSEPPAIWVVAQASQGGKRAGSALGSVQTKIKRPITFSRVTSWATNVD